MKFVCLLMIVLFTGGDWALGGNKPQLRISLKKDQRSDFDISHTTGSTSSHSRGLTRKVLLEIVVQNVTGMPAEGVQLRYVTLKRNRESKQVLVVTHGEETIAVKPLQTYSRQLDALTFMSQDKSSKTTYRMGDDAWQDSTRSRTGEEYVGIGVIALLGKDVVGKLYEPPSVEEHLKSLRWNFADVAFVPEKPKSK